MDDEKIVIGIICLKFNRSKMQFIPKNRRNEIKNDTKKKKVVSLNTGFIIFLSLNLNLKPVRKAVAPIKRIIIGSICTFSYLLRKFNPPGPMKYPIAIIIISIGINLIHFLRKISVPMIDIIKIAIIV